MKKLKLILGLALGALVMGQAQAVQIGGEVVFSGAATLDASPGAATSISFNNPITVALSTGDYAGLAPGSATFTDFTFGSVGTTGALAVSPLWSITGGWSFDITSVTNNSLSNNGQRIVEGKGLAYGTGYQATPGTWALSTSGSTSSVVFSANTKVPDSGATAALLGLGLIGLAGAARRFKK